jgi:accessory colonization factor AcfC
MARAKPGLIKSFLDELYDMSARVAVEGISVENTPDIGVFHDWTHRIKEELLRAGPQVQRTLSEG